MPLAAAPHQTCKSRSVGSARVRLIVQRHRAAIVMAFTMIPILGWSSSSSADDCLPPKWWDSLSAQTLVPRGTARKFPISSTPWLAANLQGAVLSSPSVCHFDAIDDGPIDASLSEYPLRDGWSLVYFSPDRLFLRDRTYKLTCDEGSLTSILGGDLWFQTLDSDETTAVPVDLDFIATEYISEPDSCCGHGPYFSVSLSSVDGASGFLKDGGVILVSYENGDQWVIAGDGGELLIAAPSDDGVAEVCPLAGDSTLGDCVSGAPYFSHTNGSTCTQSHGSIPAWFLVLFGFVALRTRTPARRSDESPRVRRPSTDRRSDNSTEH